MSDAKPPVPPSSSASSGVMPAVSGAAAGPKFKRNHWPTIRKRLMRGLMTPIDYFQRFHLAKHTALARFIIRIWDEGGSPRAILVILLGLALATGLTGLDQPWSQRISQERILLAFIVLAFACGTAISVRWRMWAFILSGVWLTYMSILVGSLLGETPWRMSLALPILTVAVTGWFVCRAQKTFFEGAMGWFAIAMGAGYMTSGITGFRAALGLEPLQGQLLLGQLYVLAGAVAWWVTRHREFETPNFSLVLAAAGIAMTIPVVVGASIDLHMTAWWGSDSLKNVGFLATMFWFWVGGQFAFGIWKLTDFSIRRTVRLGMGRTLAWVSPLFWIGLVMLEYLSLTGWGQAAPVMQAAGFAGKSVPEMRTAWDWHVVLTGGTILLLLVLLGMRRLTYRRLIDLNTFWFAGYLVLLAVVAKMVSFVQPGGSNSGLTLWTVPVVLVGLMVDLVRAERNWGKRTSRDVTVYLAWIAAIFAIALAGHLFEDWALGNQTKLQMLLGMLTIGLPLAIYGRTVFFHRPMTKIPVLTQVIMIVLGSSMACGIMHLNYLNPVWLLLAAPLILAVLLVQRARHPHWSRASGAMAGAMMAAGLINYWLHPEAHLIPYVSHFPKDGLIWLEARKAVTFDLMVAGIFAATGAGALLGWLVFRHVPVDFVDRTWGRGRPGMPGNAVQEN